MLTAGSSARAFVPLVFALVLIALASRYGAGVSLAGSVVAALIFAYFAYAPLGSVRVESSSARSKPRLDGADRSRGFVPVVPSRTCRAQVAAFE